MSDDLRIPSPSLGRAPSLGLGARAPVSSYRARAGADPGRKRMVLGVVAGAAVLLVAAGGWAVLGRRPATVPVIEADARPLRVKPENPGGMQVVGADDLAGADGADRMAPPPEVPAPQALRAQMQQSEPRPSPAAPPAAAVPAPAAPAASAAAPPPAAAAAPAARPVPASPRPVAAGGTLVQLAAVDSESGAQTEWQRLAKRLPDLLGDRRPAIQRADRDGHPIWRVRTGGFADIAEATGFCTRVRAKGASCTIASF